MLPPIAIVDHQASGTLELRWDEDTSHHLPYALLRASCRCAACEHTRRREGREPAVDATIELAAIAPVGDKGLNLQFTDGHGRGIYPWGYLRELAQLQP